MKWENLKNFKCPRCENNLFDDEEKYLYKSSGNNCLFAIGKVKFDKIIKGERNFIKPYEEPDRSDWD